MRDRLSTKVTPFAYTYNGKGQRNTLSEETQAVWKYDYNSRGEVKEGEKFYGPSPFAGTKRGYKYDAIGNRKELKVGTLDFNPWTANALNQLTSRDVEGKQYVLGRAAPAPALLGVTAQADNAPNAPSVTVARGPGDPASFFTATINTKNATVAKNLKVTVTEQASGGATQEAVGHLFVPASPEVFLYDLDGNLTRDGRWEYTWDAENRLVGMKTRAGLVTAGPEALPSVRLTFGYDAFGRRVSKSVETGAAGQWDYVGTTRFAYEGWNLIAEWDYDRSADEEHLARTHHWSLDLSGTLQGAGGVGGLVLTRHHSSISPQSPQSSTASCFPAYDGNGNIVALFDTVSGKRVAEYDYGPFGEPLRATGAMAEGNPFRFSTHYTDNETGLVYAKRRYYTTAGGRWLSRDPIGESGGENLTAFVVNSPISRIDPFGLEIEDYSGGYLVQPESPIISYGRQVSAVTVHGWKLGQAEFEDNATAKRFCIKKLHGVMMPVVQVDWSRANILVPYPNVTPGYGGGNTMDHEAEHVRIYGKWWNKFAAEANTFEGRCFCALKCRQLMMRYIIKVLFEANLAAAQLENTQLDVARSSLGGVADPFWKNAFQTQIQSLQQRLDKLGKAGELLQDELLKCEGL